MRPLLAALRQAKEDRVSRSLFSSFSLTFTALNHLGVVQFLLRYFYYESNNIRPNGESPLVTDFSRLFKQGLTKQAIRDAPKPTAVSILMRN
jgi:hypothetical protein